MADLVREFLGHSMHQDANPQAVNGEDCVSKKPWSVVLERSLKLFVFNAAGEGGRSIGRILFFVILGFLALGLCAYVLNSVTGLFEGWFDFWPFASSEPEPEASQGWFSFGGSETPSAPEPEGGRWYCNWNPLC